MKIVKLTDTVAVSEQITEADVAQIAEAGFKVLVNNRPDGEAPGQPDSAEIGRAAAAAGLSYHYLPITADTFPGPDVALMARLLDNPDEPVLAYCRTGTRCTNLWVATRAEDEAASAAEHARALGYDLAMSSKRS